MLGDRDKPEQTAEVIVDGWAHSGDAAEVDPHGELIVHGRTRDRIASPNGLKVYPEDVEAAIVEAGPVRPAVVFEASPGRLAAVLLPTDAAASMPTSMPPWTRPTTSFRRTSGSDAGSAGRIPTCPGPTPSRSAGPRCWPGMPRRPAGPAGSARGRRVRDSGADADDDPASSGPPTAIRRLARWQVTSSADRRGPSKIVPTSSETVLPALVDLVARVVAESGGHPDGPIGPSTTLEALGFDSLGRVGLAIQIEDLFGSSLDDSDIAGAEDLAALARVVVARRDAAPPPEPPRWAHTPQARAIRRWLDRLVTGPVVAMIGRPEVEGLEHLAGLDGPFLLCPNHASHLDAPTLRYVLPADVRERTAIAAAADYFFAGGLLGPAVGAGDRGLPVRSDRARPGLARAGRVVSRRRLERHRLPRGDPLHDRSARPVEVRDRPAGDPARCRRSCRSGSGARTGSCPRAPACRDAAVGSASGSGRR